MELVIWEGIFYLHFMAERIFIVAILFSLLDFSERRKKLFSQTCRLSSLFLFLGFTSITFCGHVSACFATLHC